MDDLLALVEVYKPHIIAVTESWCNNDIFDSELSIPGYDLFRMDRPLDNKGGGVLLYVGADLGAVEWSPKTQFPEQVWCRLNVSRNTNLLVGVCYNSRNGNLFPNNDALIQELIREIRTQHVLLMGDFNYGGINWHTFQASEAPSQQFLDCLEDCFLIQHVTEPTRGDSLLDLVLTDEPGMIDSINVYGHFSTSDHNVLHWSTTVATKKVVITDTIRDFNKADIASIKKELRSTVWDFDSDVKVSDLWIAFSRKIEDLITKHVPVRKLKSGKCKKALWMTGKAVRAVKLKHKTFSRYRDITHPAYIKASAAAKQEIRRAKRNFEVKLSDNIKTDKKSFYAYVRSRCKSRVKVGPLVQESGSTVTDGKHIAEVLNDYFSSVFTKEVTSSMPEARRIFTGDNSEVLKDITVDVDIVRTKLKALRPDKAAGPDNIPPKLLRELSEELCHPLSVILQRSLDEGVVPNDWKLANVCPIHKKGSRAQASNYRPVSLTSQICKVLESVIRTVVVDHLEKYSLIKDSQHGFRRGRSCLTNLLEFLDKVTRSVDTGDNIDVIYLDFAKAFDKVPHCRLIKKVEAHGIGGKILAWITDWLHGRKQRVCLQGLCSCWQSVWSGVPQGSVLGPVLFLIFINDLDCGILSSILKFADDTKLFGIVNSLDDGQILQNDLGKLTDWSHDWLMAFNVDKCKVMHIGRTNVHSKYYMNGAELGNTTEEKDLGVIVADNLMVAKHCAYAYSKGNRILGMIKRTVVSRDVHILLNLYKTLVRPHLEYCSPAWSPHYQKDKQLLERVQHRFTRLFSELRKLCYNDRLRRLGLWSLEERRNRADLLEVFKLKSGLSTISLQSFFDCNVEKRTRGHSWKIVKNRCKLDIRKYFFSERVVNRWNSLSQVDVDQRTINGFKRALDRRRKAEMDFFMD